MNQDLNAPTLVFPGFVRWVLVLAASAAIIAYATNVAAEFSLTRRPVFDLIFLGAIANLLWYMFVRTYPGWTGRRHALLIGCAVLLQVAAFACLRMDGLYGNGRPRLVTRWSKAAADREFSQTAEQAFEFDPTTAAAWSGFRGQDRTGAFDGIQLRDWRSHPPRLVWSRDIGAGWSAFAVADSVCITQEQRGDNEAVVCYELTTGKQLWIHLDRARFSDVTSGDGPRATPTIDKDLVFSFGATGILNCLEISTGELVWTRNVLEENRIDNCNFGMVGSPLLTSNRVIVAPGGNGSSLIAYDRLEGNQIWAAGDETASYSSPQPADVCAVPSVLSFNGDGLSCHRLSDGRQLFHVPWTSNSVEKNNVCQPIVRGGTDSQTHVFVSSGYGRGSTLMKVVREGDKYDVLTIWKSKGLKSKFASAVIYDGFVYGLDNGILTCLSLENGQRMWKQGRYGHGQLIRIGGRLVVVSERGYIALVDCNPNRFTEISRFDALQDRTWNHPAFDGRFLVIRNDQTAMCFELQSTTAAPEELQDEQGKLK